ncbi:MAG: class I SAM-dependent methyltransferase [Bacteroidetes bacterium]|nr:class I SAM-dependent methyltransferase [Bacteroidota bacterium]
MRQFFYQTTYRRVKDESHIHWHHEEIPVLLREAVQSLNGSGMVLDIGCGTGVNSVFMAQQGLDVTAIDFVPEALEFARRRAEKFGVDVNFIRADVTKFDAPVKYDLIVDAGCFHGFDDKARMAYKERLLSWLSDNSNYLLIHLGKRHVFDFGILGPHAKTKSEIEPLLSGC